MPQVHVIEPIYSHEPAKLRVCAYARVSSDSADQLNSFAAQVRYYTNLIAGNEDWMLVDIYADRGITGTSTAKRAEFQRMMEDCRKGKIDRILVKSLSRFARNTQDCIAALRELRQLGVTVVFEKEHINTGTMANEMLISMMSAFAQEESVSISKNVRKGIVMRMQNGEFHGSFTPYGYRLSPDGSLSVYPEEAEVVKRIFSDFLAGKSSREIADSLIQQGVPKRKGCSVWSDRGIVYLLTNEKYVGDERLQKYISTRTLPSKCVMNRGQEPQFYFHNTHEAIITRESFDRVQALLDGRRELFRHKQKNTQPPLSGWMTCGLCGASLYRKNRNGRICWVCSRHLQKASACSLPSIQETVVWNSIRRLASNLTDNTHAILESYCQNLEIIRQRRSFLSPGVSSYHQQISDLLTQSHTLVRLRTNGCIDSAFFIAQNNAIQKKLAILKEQLDRQRREDQINEKIEATRSLMEALSHLRETDTNPDLIKRCITGATVYADRIVFEMTNGLYFSERIHR